MHSANAWRGVAGGGPGLSTEEGRLTIVDRKLTRPTTAMAATAPTSVLARVSMQGIILMMCPAGALLGSLWLARLESTGGEMALSARLLAATNCNCSALRDMQLSNRCNELWRSRRCLYCNSRLIVEWLPLPKLCTPPRQIGAAVWNCEGCRCVRERSGGRRRALAPEKKRSRKREANDLDGFSRRGGHGRIYLVLRKMVANWKANKKESGRGNRPTRCNLSSALLIVLHSTSIISYTQGLIPRLFRCMPV